MAAAKMGISAVRWELWTGRTTGSRCYSWRLEECLAGKRVNARVRGHLRGAGSRGGLGADVGAIFCSGLMTYWLALELVHAATHLPESWYQHRPFRGPVLRYLRAFHRAHHDPKLMRQGNFNVTFPFWDFIFGTALPVMSADSLDEGSEPLVTEPA